MLLSKKTQQLLALCSTIILLVLLTAGLPGLALMEGTDYTGALDLVTEEGEMNILPFVFFSLIVISLIAFIILRKYKHHKIFQYATLLVLLLLGIVMLIVSFATPVEIEMAEEEEVAGEQEGANQEEMVLLPEAGPFVEVEPFESPPDWIGLIASILIAFVFLTIVAVLIWVFGNTKPDPHEEEVVAPLTELTQQAQQAIQALQQGQALTDVVLRCYADMERVLVTTQGVQRRKTMTAREFERQLLQLGLPAVPVRELTRLFETVRYSQYTPSEEDQSRAVSNLTSIVAACEALSSPMTDGGQMAVLAEAG